MNIETQVAVVHHAAAPADAATSEDTATTVKMLGDLERMHASGALADDECDALKRKLLGET